MCADKKLNSQEPPPQSNSEAGVLVCYRDFSFLLSLLNYEVTVEIMGQSLNDYFSRR